MAISYSSLAASVTNWQPVTSSTPSGVSTVTFSGLAGYSKYRILAPNLVPSGAAHFQVRFNGDSGSNYQYYWIGETGGTFNAFNGYNLSYFGWSTASYDGAAPQAFQFDIDHALLATPKFISGSYALGGSGGPITGTYNTTSAITSITILSSNNNFSTGTIYILGAN